MPLRNYKRRTYKRKLRKTNRKLATVSTVKKLIGYNQEHKYFDSIYVRQGFYNDPTLFNLNPIPQGAGDSYRNGDIIIGKKLTVSGHVFGDAVTNVCRVRLILFHYYGHPGSTPDETIILQHSSTNDQMLCSPFHHDNKSQYQVLKDKSFFVVAQSGGVGSPAKSFKFSTSLKRKKIQFDAASTNCYNSIWMMAMADAGIASQQPKIAFTSRLTYTDS